MYHAFVRRRARRLMHTHEVDTSRSLFETVHIITTRARRGHAMGTARVKGVQQSHCNPTCGVQCTLRTCASLPKVVPCSKAGQLPPAVCPRGALQSGLDAAFTPWHTSGGGFNVVRLCRARRPAFGSCTQQVVGCVVRLECDGFLYKAALRFPTLCSLDTWQRRVEQRDCRGQPSSARRIT